MKQILAQKTQVHEFCIDRQEKRCNLKSKQIRIAYIIIIVVDVFIVC